MNENAPINFIAENEQNDVFYQKNNNKKKIIALIFLFTTLFALIFLTFKVFSSDKPSNDPTVYDPSTLEPIKPKGFFKKITNLVFNNENKLEGQKEDRINILLLGIGGAGHEGPYLSDTMMIASIQPSTKKVAMISIPRDLWVKMPEAGWHKINYADAYGEMQKTNMGAAFATKVVEDVFDINIHYYIRVDFKAFEEIIDEVGGIKVNVEKSFVDQMFPAPNYEYQTVSFQKGIQTMAGEKALQYARSRHGNNGEGSDFARAKRQQKMLLALKEKVLSFGTLANPIHINNIIQSLDQHILTNLQLGDIITLLKIAKELDTENINTAVLDTSPNGYLQNSFTADGAYILAPKTGNFNQINEMIKNIFDSNTSIVKNDTPSQDKPAEYKANVEILNGTWNAGMAARMKKRLEDKGYIITKIGNTVNRPQSNSGIFKTTNQDVSGVLLSLQEELQIPIKQSPPTGETSSTGSDILIILGENFQ